jgi:hypothetical protein
MNEEPLRSGLTFGAVEPVGSIDSTVVVRTSEVGVVEARDIGRIITSSPSNVKPESREFNSASALTASVLTTAG